MKSLIAHHTCVDMHFHTNFSDGSASIDKTIEKALRLGIGVAITDHNEYRGAALAIKKYGKDLLIIPAMELSSREGRDLLIYFYSLKDLVDFQETFVEPKRKRNPHGRINVSLFESIAYIRHYPAVITIAHPFGILWKRMEKLPAYEKIVEQSDAVEIINGSLSKNDNFLAKTWQYTKGKGITAGSDGHHLIGLGSALTVVPGKNHSIKSFLDSIRNKENFVAGSAMSFTEKIISHAHLAFNHAKFYIPGFPSYYTIWKTAQVNAYGDVA